MEESDFWPRLEFRVCAELRGFEDKQLRWYWCDGLVPEDYDLQGEEPTIRGRAWCGPSGQEPWRFVLLIDRSTRSRDEIDWSALLPDERLTEWLIPDVGNKTITMNPLSGRPD